MIIKVTVCSGTEEFTYHMDAVDIEEAEEIAKEDYPDAYITVEETEYKYS